MDPRKSPADKKDGRKFDHETLERMRLEAMDKVVNGESPEMVVQEMGLSRSCIYKWMAKFRVGGMGALKAKTISGRPAKVEADQVGQLREILVGNTPDGLYFDRGLWTREIVRELLLQRFGLKLSPPSVSRLLHKVGVVFHRPLYKQGETNNPSIEHWVQIDYAKIKAQARKLRAEIFICWDGFLYGEQSGSNQDQDPVPNGIAFSDLIQISAVNTRGVDHFLLIENRTMDEALCKFIDGLCLGRRLPVFLVVNDHPVYRTPAFKKCVLNYRSLLSLYYFPLRNSLEETQRKNIDLGNDLLSKSATRHYAPFLRLGILLLFILRTGWLILRHLGLEEPRS